MKTQLHKSLRDRWINLPRIVVWGLPILIGVIFLVIYLSTRQAGDPDDESKLYSGKGSLIELSTKGDLAGVRTIATPSNVNSPEDGDYPLHQACEQGHLEVAIHLLCLGARLDLSDGYGRYPIHRAAAGGNLELFRILEAAGANINQKTSDPVADKLRMDHQYRRALRGSGINSDPNDEAQPIHIAASWKNCSLAICQYLLEKGVSPTVQDGKGRSPLSYALYLGGWIPSNTDVIRLFDSESIKENIFRKALGPDGIVVRTGGVYMRELRSGGSAKIHCLELGGDMRAKFAIFEGEASLSATKESFQHRDESDYYMGHYSLIGPSMDRLELSLNIPDAVLKTLKGKAAGDTIEFVPMLPAGYTDDGYGSYQGEFKFYAY